MTSTHELAHALALVSIDAALAVADYLLRAVRTVDGVETKADFHDPVTVHDRLVEASLHSILAAAVPGSRVLGEETGARTLVPDELLPPPVGIDAPSSPRWRESALIVRDLGERVRWIIDPIDGTANFAAGLPWFNTSIAAELDGTVVAGVVCAPVLAEVFAADDERTWYTGPGGKMDLTSQGPTTEAEAVLVSYHPGARAMREKSSVLEGRMLVEAFQSTRRLGAAALDLAYVAAGWIGAMIGANFKPWDVAAGIHLVRVAGGNVYSLPMGTDLPDGLRPGVVASTRGFEAPTARAVLDAINARR